MATDFHVEKNQIFGKNTDQISRELNLRPKHIGFRASQMKFKGFSGPPMQFKAFLTFIMLRFIFFEYRVPLRFFAKKSLFHHFSGFKKHYVAFSKKLILALGDRYKSVYRYVLCLNIIKSSNELPF